MSDDSTLDANAQQKVARAELAKRVLIVVIFVLVTINQITMVALLSKGTEILSEIRSTQKVGSPTLKAISAQQDDIEEAATSSTKLLDLILDCFDPNSQCARDAAARQAEQQGAYIASVVASQYCVDQVLPDAYTIEQLTVCVGRRLDGNEGDHR